MCYKCREKYSLDHKCPKKQLHIVLIEDLQEEDGEEYLMYISKKEGIEVSEETNKVEEGIEASINAMIGDYNHSTIRI